MSIIQELVDTFPFTDAPRILQRHEDLLLAEPHAGPVKMWRDQPPLEAVHIPQEYTPQKFAPPRGVYESDYLRLEWQTMDNRQPFYHRNCDVDELSYQIQGERTLMTELGTVEMRPGDFSRIPRGVAHDNYGRKQSHLLFYIPAPVEDLLTPVRISEQLVPPFPGWAPAPLNELTTQCLGGPEHDVAISPIDEQLLLEHASQEKDRINIVRPHDGTATCWLYRSAGVMIGHTQLATSAGAQYQRHLDVDEIQYQISGHRTLVSQRGSLELEPGDFVRIPVGVAFTNVNAAPSTHITLVSTTPIPLVAPSTKTAERLVPGELEQLRRG